MQLTMTMRYGQENGLCWHCDDLRPKEDMIVYNGRYFCSYRCINRHRLKRKEGDKYEQIQETYTKEEKQKNVPERNGNKKN